MKRFIAIVLLACMMLSIPLFSLSLEGYEPYNNGEFPKWSLDLRRSECIFFGGIPITFPVSALAFNLAKKDASFLETLGVACAISAVITVVDYVLGVINAD